MNTQNNHNSSVADLHLEETMIPINVEETAKEQRKWLSEAVPGILVFVWHAANNSPAFVYSGDDKADGIKYGVMILLKETCHGHEDYFKIERLNQTLNSIIKDGDDIAMKWAQYICDEFNRDPNLGKSETSYAAASSKECFVWTKNREEFSPLVSTVSKAIRKLAEQSDLKKTEDDPKKKYYDYVNNKLPELLKDGIDYAIDAYIRLAWDAQTRSVNLDDVTIGIIVDVEKSALVFVKNYYEVEDLRDAEVFYTYDEQMIKTCDEWCTELKLNNAQEACHWISATVRLIEKDEYPCFEKIEQLTVFGNYMYDDEGEMDVLFEKGKD